LKALADAIVASGARASVEARISDLVHTSRAALQSLPVGDGVKRILSGAAHALTERTS
jgi:hypothetical protein